jgi:aspartate kinase
MMAMDEAGDARRTGPLVMKFGGTSVGSAERIRDAAQLVAMSRGRRPVVIVSAVSGVTNTLLEGVEHAAAGRDPDVQGILAKLRAIHTRVATCIDDADDRAAALTEIESVLEALGRFYAAIGMMGEPIPALVDRVAACGEKCSAPIVAAALRGIGIPAAAVSAEQCIVTNGVFGNADPLVEPTRIACENVLAPLIQAGTVPVVTGFIGRSTDGQTVTLGGRGGSDYSATVIGAALAASEVWIWTDVDGIMTTDPRVVPQAVPLAALSYDEAGELAHYGAKVIHPRAIQPLMPGAIPLRIKNTFHPEFAGTLIAADAGDPDGETVVKGIATLRAVGLITVQVAGRSHLARFVTAIRGALGDLNARLVFTTTTGTSCHVGVGATGAALAEMLAHLRSTLRDDIITDMVRRLAMQDEAACVAVVGEGVGAEPDVAARVGRVLGAANVPMYAVGGDPAGRSLIVTVPGIHADEATRRLHAEFCVPAVVVAGAAAASFV